MSSPYLDFVGAVVAGNVHDVARRLAVDPALATTASTEGASRRSASRYFFPEIVHGFYAGDTPLHIAAAGFRREVAALLVAHGAESRAKNRRGAEPLHYAADANRWEPIAQAETVEYLIAIGADPNAVDRSGVSPLLRAVRTRSLAAVRALVVGGAEVRKPNHAGSTPLHLAVQTTGRGGSGSPAARREQPAIIRLLLEHGAVPTDRDGRDRSVSQSASEWSRAVLREAGAD